MTSGKKRSSNQSKGFIAVVLAILAVLPLAVNLAYAHQPAWLRGLVAGAALGLALGVGQWWVLHRPLSLSRLWIVGSLIGGALGLASGLQLAESVSVTAVAQPISRSGEPRLATGPALDAASSGLLFGLLLGLLQWLWLRQRVPNASWWLVANAVGWAAALGLAALWPGGGASGWLGGSEKITIPGRRAQGAANQDYSSREASSAAPYAPTHAGTLYFSEWPY